MAASSDGNALTDYAQRYLVDQLSTVDGVAQVQFGGAQAMRCGSGSTAPRSPRAAHGDDIETALRARNVDLPAGG